MEINWERILVGIVTLIFCFALIFADAEGYINISKFGYAGVGSWLTLIIQFYFRKANPKGKEGIISSSPFKGEDQAEAGTK